MDWLLILGIVFIAILACWLLFGFWVWFFKTKWKGLPPKGWKSDDGGRTWHP